ncbi:TPA: hypothetical protein N0F65_006534 [Lagenidium giganteum]|uniref:MYND-type domain-containing protein n=1 Tax=Lagenidium giganteum TaxID=4803 RepID=A0AAV2YJ29_9STRA|nr:TPA: hypothetical protein N0F65_006534 [Lagenidium giganteum]
MADSDSDDELMSKLAGGFSHRVAHYEDCAHCNTPHASLPCTSCQEVYYCNEVRQTCKRRHFKAHRAFCISTRMQKEQSESEESEEESESEVEDNQRASGTRGGLLGDGNGAAGGVKVPGLTDKQLKRLLDLSAKAEAMANSKVIDDLQRQIAELKSMRASTSEAVAASSAAKLKDIKALEKKLKELEKRTESMQVGGAATNAFHTTQPVYTPLVVKADDAFKKYFKLKDMSMPIEQIKAKMEADGVNSALLDTPDAISPNDPGPAEGAYIPLTVGEDPKFKKYFKLKLMDMPIDQIKLKMEAEGVDPHYLDNPHSVSPNDPGVRWRRHSRVSGDPNSPVSPAYRMSLPGIPLAMPPASPSPAYEPLLVKDDPSFKKFFKLQQMGMPAEQIKMKMHAEGLDTSLLDRPDDVSPNDKGPPAAASDDVPKAPVSMEQLFSILMQHQHIIQQGLGGGNAPNSGNSARSSFTNVSAPPSSVEDQMAKELAAAESAIDDIFGDEHQRKGSGGMSMIEQLEKKARKEGNKKIVDNRDEINRLVKLVLETELSSDEEAIKFYSEVCQQLDHLGLSLGVDAVQTWSARLLIKNKDTKDWYFSEQERLDAGNAYVRMWGLSFLERDAGQLIAKRQQILNAPTTLRAVVKNKVELIERFTQLLKDAVKLKHKIFKNNLFPAEVRRLQEHRIPERFEERGVELIDAGTVLADAAMDLAEEEFRVLAATTRAKKIRAHTVVHVAERTIQFVGIVKKIGAKGVSVARLTDIETKMQEIKDAFLGQEEHEEEEDDVL